MILRNDWLPPMAALGTRGALLDGNSGNADFDSIAGVALLFAPGPGTEVGTRGTGAADEAVAVDEAHGVKR